MTYRCVALFSLVVLAACGGSEDPTSPPGPTAVATVSVSPTTVDMIAGDTEQLQVTLSDATGVTLTGRTITYASSSGAVAAVSSTGLVTAVGAGSATITATSEGRSGSTSLTVEWAAFAPRAATTLSGTNTFASVSVPDGVEITVTGDASLVSVGDLSISGAISGDCGELTVSGATLTITGTVSNVCSTSGSADLHLISTGDLTLTGAVLASSGDVRITNDETLSDSDFDPMMLVTGVAARAATGQMGTCTISGVVPVQGGVSKAPGGTTGDDGSDGGNWRLDCNGDVDIDGNADITGGTEIDTPDAGDGGDVNDGDVTDPSNTDGSRGAGGNGGELRIRATGNVNFSGTSSNPTRILLADGGDGGDQVDIGDGPGVSASAIGGSGGKSGTFSGRANGNINIANAGGLEIVVGAGGDGGDATAVGIDGLPAEDGASATATGGDGGETPDAQLRGQGNVTGAGDITMSGGKGGEANANAGAGGDGTQADKDGGGGGAMVARSGTGGDAGGADIRGGEGGNGWDGCSVNPPEAGGKGGKGGDATGELGLPGFGVNSGAGGTVTVGAATGDGGNGGDGDATGLGGDAGADNISAGAGGTRVDEGPNFRDGVAGNPCPNFTVDSSGLPTDFSHTVGTTSCPQAIGTITLTNNSSSQSLTWTTSTAPPLAVAGSTSGSLEPGGSVTITVSFDCSQSTSFTETLQLSVTQAGTTTPQSFTIAGTVG